MNHFEFGFFDELEKIATNKALVAENKAFFKGLYPKASRSAIGQRATSFSQYQMGTDSRLSKTPPADPRFNSTLFDMTIPIPGKTKVGRGVDQNTQPRRVVNRAQLNKIFSRAGALADSHDRMDPPNLDRRRERTGF